MTQTQPPVTPLDTVTTGVAPGGGSTSDNTTRPFRDGGGGLGGPGVIQEGTTGYKESKAERCKRLLAGPIGRVVRPAAELRFDYARATQLATQCVRPSEPLEQDRQTTRAL